MGLFLLKRFATLIATLAGASLVVFAVLEVLPGNAAQMLMGPDAAPEAVAALANRLGLDQPAWQRYGQWISGLLQGDMGLSYAYSTPVSELVLERLALERNALYEEVADFVIQTDDQSAKVVANQIVKLIGM